MYSVTEAFVTWLTSLGFRASTRAPQGDAGEFVTVERTGGTVEDMVDRPMMAVQCWAPSEVRAEQMALSVRSAALLGARPHGVHSMSVNAGPYAFYDESTRMPRYQLVFDVACQLVS